MRPLFLEMVAFRSYDRADVDWSQHDLVVIAGDTGSGKTSLLDAISFALYGRTPEAGKASELLTLGHTHGEVRLTFALNTQCWRVTRRYGPDAPAPAQLLERLEDDHPIETFDGDVDGRLQDLIGMSFKAFTSAVLLAQGQFAQFLASQPRDRDNILRELFNVVSMDDVRQAAVNLGKTHAGSAEGLLKAADSLSGHDVAAWWDEARRARAQATRAAALASLQVHVEKIEKLEESCQAQDDAVGRLNDALDALPDASKAREIEQRIGDASANVTAAKGRARETKKRYDQAIAARTEIHDDPIELSALREKAERLAHFAKELPEREQQHARQVAELRDQQAAHERNRAEQTYLSGRIEALRAFVTEWDVHLQMKTAANAAEEAVATAAKAFEIAKTDHDATIIARKEANEVYERAVREDAATTVRAGVRDGDTCPVCGGRIGDHPEHVVPTTHDRARVASMRDEASDAERRAATARVAAHTVHEDAKSARDAAYKNLNENPPPVSHNDDTQGSRDEVAGRLEALTEELHQRRAADVAKERDLASAEGRIDGQSAQLERDLAAFARDRTELGSWTDHADPVRAIGIALDTVTAADAAVSDAQQAHTIALATVNTAENALREVRENETAELRAAAQRAAHTAGVPPIPTTVATEDLPQHLDDLRDLLVTTRAHHETRRDDLRAARTRALNTFKATASPWGVDAPTMLRDAQVRAGHDLRDAQNRLANIRRNAADAQRLRRQAAAEERAAASFNHVANDLRANGFPRFLLERFRERLATGASTRLQELSNGMYRFAGSGTDPLDIVDMRRGEKRRSANTLSGGERFLASLALALGLSDIAAESGGRLECLFLDEGFSTLDAESLEQALSGVERLAGDGRLIAVITHLPGVAERLGAALRVAKDAGGTSRIVDEMVSQSA